MGMMIHKTILLISNEKKALKKIRKKAKSLLPKFTTKIMGSGMNGYHSFCIVPSGSYEDWDLDIKHKMCIKHIKKMAEKSKTVQFIYCQFGDQPPEIEHG